MLLLLKSSVGNQAEQKKQAVQCAAHSSKGGVLVKLVQTDFAEKPTREMKGETARFSLQQARSAYVYTLVMSCRGRCKPSGPQLQDRLVGLGQQILSHALFFHSIHPLSSTPPHPQLPKEALLGLAQQSLFPCRTGQLPQAIPGTSFTCWDTNLCQKGRVSVALHRDRVGPGSTAVLGRQWSLHSTQVCCRRGCDKPCPEPFSP